MRKPKGAKLYSVILTTFLSRSPAWFEFAIRKGKTNFWSEIRPRTRIHTNTRRNRWNFVMDRIPDTEYREKYLSILEKLLETYKDFIGREVEVKDDVIHDIFDEIDDKFGNELMKLIDDFNRDKDDATESEVLPVLVDVYRRIVNDKIANSILRASTPEQVPAYQLKPETKARLKKRVNASKVLLSFAWILAHIDSTKLPNFDESFEHCYLFYTFSNTSYWKMRTRGELITEVDNYIYKEGESFDDLSKYRITEPQVLNITAFYNKLSDNDEDFQEMLSGDKYSDMAELLSKMINVLKAMDLKEEKPIYLSFVVNPQDYHIWKLFKAYRENFENALETLPEEIKAPIKEDYKKVIIENIKKITDEIMKKINTITGISSVVIEDLESEPLEEVGLFPYIGAKKKKSLRESIISAFPEHKIYIEPMVGSGAIFVYKQPVKYAILNDLNPIIYAIWKGIKDGTVNPEMLEKAYNEFTEIKEIILSKEKNYKDKAHDRAKEILENSGWNTNYAFVGSFIFMNDVFNKFKNSRKFISTIQSGGLPSWSWIIGRYSLMKKAIDSHIDTLILNRNIVDLLAMLRKKGYDREDVVIYIDPPYIGAEHNYYNKDDIKNEIYELNERIVNEAKRWNKANIFVSNYIEFLDIAGDLFDVAKVIDIYPPLKAPNKYASKETKKEYLFKKKTTL